MGFCNLLYDLFLIYGKYDSDMKVTACVPNGFLANVSCQKLCNIVIHSDWCIWFQNFSLRYLHSVTVIIEIYAIKYFKSTFKRILMVLC
jgi:hypothetical protein